MPFKSEMRTARNNFDFQKSIQVSNQNGQKVRSVHFSAILLFELLRLLVGAHHPLVLLKSQLNFQTGKLNFDEILYMEPFPALHAYADSALYIIFQSLLKDA